MLYNISYEVSTLFFLIVIWVFYKAQYKSKTVLNNCYEKLVILVFFMTLTDIISAITISYYKVIPIAVNYISNMSNYIFVGLAAYFFVTYIEKLVYGDEAENPVRNRVILSAYLILEFMNPFFGYFWSFTKEEGYIHGPFYLMQMLVDYYFIFYTAIVLVYNLKKMDRRRFIATGSYVGVMLVFGLGQVFVFPNILMSGFASTLSILIIFLTMETPDYYKLMQTMDELEAAKISANAASDAKSKFLANMSHEIRTPLNTVLGMDEMILREASDDDIIDYARNIRSSGNNLLGIINDILDFSKIESGMMTISEFNYEIAGTISNVYTMLSQKALDKGLRLELNVDENIPKTLYGDEMRISQIIINLVNNAIKYTDTGLVTLSINLGNGEEENVALLVISVKDTGIGIKDEDKEKLFKEFERLDLQRNRTVEGTGLGLAITGRLVNQMNGKISVESVYEVGSRFTVELPQVIVDKTPIGKFEVKSSASDDENYKESFTAPEARILAVDDNKVNLEVLKKLLKNTLVQITTATSGKKALSLIADNDFDLVLMDHMMPEMDGIQTLHKAKELEERTGRHSIYVALTANAIQGADKMYISEGFNDYITKPISSKELERKLLLYLPQEKVVKS